MDSSISGDPFAPEPDTIKAVEPVEALPEPQPVDENGDLIPAPADSEPESEPQPAQGAPAPEDVQPDPEPDADGSEPENAPLPLPLPDAVVPEPVPGVTPEVQTTPTEEENPDGLSD